MAGLSIPRRKKLHPKQRKLLEILGKHQADPLSIRDLQGVLGVSSPSVIQHHLRMLERNGYLKRNPADPRHYSVVGTTPEASIARLPLYGLVQCGRKGSVLDSEPLDHVALGARFLPFPADQVFLVKARGDSMVPKIAEGDMVLVRKTVVAEQGATVVCVNKGESMIKVLRKASGRDLILSSVNSAKHPPFLASGDFRIEGVVVGVISYHVG